MNLKVKLNYMKPTNYKERRYSVTEDVLNEDDEEVEDDANDGQMDDEKLKIEALKIAISISKLMSNVVPSDVIEISKTVADFIRNHEISQSAPTDDVTTPTEETETSTEEDETAAEGEESTESTTEETEDFTI